MYTQNQIDSVVNLLGAEMVIKHILGQERSFKVMTAMQISLENGGIFSQTEIQLINDTQEIDF